MVYLLTRHHRNTYKHNLSVVFVLQVTVKARLPVGDWLIPGSWMCFLHEFMDAGNLQIRVNAG